MKIATVVLLILSVILLAFSFPKNNIKNGKTIMAIFAHADDELFIAPVLSKYANEGYTVYWAVATKGEKGVRQHAGVPKGDSLARVRVNEAICASKALGITAPIFLGLNDGELDEDFTGEPLRKKIDSIITQYKPSIIITWGPDGGYGHVDHRLVCANVSEIFQSGRHAGLQNLYYINVPTENWMKMPAYKTGLFKFFHQSWKPAKKEYLTTRIKCEEKYMTNAANALNCYNSQFTKEEMGDVDLWTKQMNKDSFYLRSFKSTGKLEYKLSE